MKKKTVSEELARRAAEISEECAGWRYAYENGCSDPNWPDGTNLNLKRAHVIYCKTEIARICADAGLPLPEEYYTPTPPEVSEGYMASLAPEDPYQKKRIAHLLERGEKLVKKRPAVDWDQTSLL